MENVFAIDESQKWEHQITKEEKLVATGKRLYLVNVDNSRIAVIFRKAITGCEYTYKSYFAAAVATLIIGLLVSLGLFNQSGGAAFLCFIIFLFVGLGLMCKEEKLTINLAGGNNIKLVRRKYFALNFQKELDARIKDISALEDI